MTDPNSKFNIPNSSSKKGFYLSEDGEWVPDGWSTGTLGNDGRVQPGFAFKSQHMGEQGIPLVKITEIQPPYVNMNGATRVAVEPYSNKNLSKFEIRKGDSLVAMTGATIGKVGKFLDDETAWLNQRVAKISGNGSTSDRYIYYVLKSNRFAQHVTNTSSGSSAQQNISGGELESYPFPLPPPAEQKAIAAVLGSLDDKIELLREQNETLEALAQTLFKRWFIDFNFPDENGNPYKDSGGKMIPSELGEIPEEWRCEGLTEHLDVMGGGTPKTSVPEFWDGEFGFFTPKDASSDFYCLSTEKRVTQAGIDSSSTKLFPENTIFVTARGTVGKTALALVPMAMNQSCYALKEKNGYNFSGFLLLREAIHKLKKYASGGVFDAITTNTLAGTLMAYPSEYFVEGFEKVITPLFLKLGDNTKQIQTLTQLRDTLLPKLMRGEIRVPVKS